MIILIDNKLSSIGKVTSILKFLSEEPYKYKVAEISNATGINRSSVHRILYELMDEGFIIQEEESGKFCIGASLYNIGMVYLHNAHYESSIQAVLEEAAKLTEESVGLAIRDGDRIISIYETEVHQRYKMMYRSGVFYPMNRGCYGKLLMAYHDEEKVKEIVYKQSFEKICKNTLTDPQEILEEYKRIKEQGYVISDEETLPLLEGVGVPIFSSSGQVKYCIAMAFLKDENYLEKRKEFIEILRKSADKISKLIP